MGKTALRIPQQRQSDEEAVAGPSRGGSSGLLCDGCSMALRRYDKEFRFKCFFFLILSFSVFLSGFFWLLPLHSVKFGFDARYDIKLSATVQAYFRLEVPVENLLPQIGVLEYDINMEIGVPDVKVAILSMHQLGASNWSYVVFGFLSDSINFPINEVSLSVLRSSLVDLFLQQSNLTLTTSIFGQPSAFEILKFSGGITVVPPQSAFIWQIPQVLFNFTLNNSMSEMLERFEEFRNQLKVGLHLRPYENVYVQITNKNGSTILPPVVVQASVFSVLGSLMPQRLKQLAELIIAFTAQNLGLDNSVFGEVKSIILSSYLKGALYSIPPKPSPAPSPELIDYADPPPSPYLPPSSSYIPRPSPCSNCEAPSPPDPCLNRGSSGAPASNNPTDPSLVGPTSHLSPNTSPTPEVSYSCSANEGRVKYLVSPSLVASSSSSVVGLFGFSGTLIFHLVCWLWR